MRNNSMMSHGVGAMFRKAALPFLFLFGALLLACPAHSGAQDGGTPTLGFSNISVSEPICPNKPVVTATIEVYPAGLDLGQQVSVSAEAKNSAETLTFTSTGTLNSATDSAGQTVYRGEVAVTLDAADVAGSWTLTVGGNYDVNGNQGGFGDVVGFNVDLSSPGCHEPAISIDAITVSNAICPDPATVTAKVTVYPSTQSDPTGVDLGPEIAIRASATDASDTQTFEGTATLTRSEVSANTFEYRGEVAVVMPATATGNDWVLTVAGDAGGGYSEIQGFTVAHGTANCNANATATPTAATPTPASSTPTPTAGTPGPATPAPTSTPVVAAATPTSDVASGGGAGGAKSTPTPVVDPPKPGSNGNLAFTGTQTVVVALVALTVVGVGIALVAATRRMD